MKLKLILLTFTKSYKINYNYIRQLLLYLLTNFVPVKWRQSKVGNIDFALDDLIIFDLKKFKNTSCDIIMLRSAPYYI